MSHSTRSRKGAIRSLWLTARLRRGEALRKTHQKYAAMQGIDLRFPARAGCTDLALGALCCIDSDPVAFIRAAFSAYWESHLDLDDAVVVQGIIDASGLHCHSGPGQWRDELSAALQQAAAVGVVDAPAYVIEGQVFIGRQHFPWLEELLTGRAVGTAG